MARRCDITGKQTSYGGNRKHKRGSSGGGGVWRYKATNTNRTWKPNLKKVALVEISTGKQNTYKISMKAYKRLRKDGKFQGYRLKK